MFTRVPLRASMLRRNAGVAASQIGVIALYKAQANLLRKKIDEQCGVARTPWVPVAWVGHVWSGLGTPVESVTMDSLGCLRSGCVLPSMSALAESHALEASAARALDLLDPC